MRIHCPHFGMTLVLTLGLLGLGSLSAHAVRLSDGTVAFAAAPQLEGTSASQTSAYFWGSSYYFTVTLPEAAGEPLQRVTISQEDNVSYAHFDLSKTEAYEGTRRRSGTKLPIQAVTRDPQKRLITVTFDPPVAPGRNITIELYAERNPDIGGVYLYGVTAYPAGEKAFGQFLGYGRIHIYDNRETFFFRPFYRWR